MSDVVETKPNSDIFDIPRKPDHNAQAQEQEVKDCTEFLKIEREKYMLYKSILDGVEECVDDENNLDAELRKKIKNIMLGGQVHQTRQSDVPIKDNLENILGVPPSNLELTYTESSNLQSCLKSKLDSKFATLKSAHRFDRDSFRKEKSESPLELTHNDAVLLECRTKLVTQQEMYMKNQLALLELLEELKNCRLETVPSTTNQKYEECSSMARINYLKAQLATNLHRIDIFMDSNNTFKAYTEFLNDLKVQKDELTLEIERLKKLKQKYADVSCKEYDDILKSYLQYKASLEKKKRMQELCA